MRTFRVVVFWSLFPPCSHPTSLSSESFANISIGNDKYFREIHVKNFEHSVHNTTVTKLHHRTKSMLNKSCQCVMDGHMREFHPLSSKKKPQNCIINWRRFLSSGEDVFQAKSLHSNRTSNHYLSRETTFSEIKQLCLNLGNHLLTMVYFSKILAKTFSPLEIENKHQNGELCY